MNPAILDDPDFLDLPESEQDSIVQSMQGPSKPNPLMEGAKTLGKGVMKGGLGILQTAENIGSSMMGGRHTNVQKLIDSSNAGIEELFPTSKFDKSTTGKVVSGVGQLPGLVTQVMGMGGGVPGMAMQSAFSEKDASAGDRVGLGIKGALLGKAYQMIGGMRAAPEAGMAGQGAAMLSRVGLGGTLGGVITAATGGDDSDIYSQGILGGFQSAKAKPYTKAELDQRGLKKSYEFLQPPKAETAEYRDRGKEHPAVEQFYKNVEPNKDLDVVAGGLKSKAAEKMKERDAKLKSNEQRQSRDYLDPLYRKIQEYKAEGVDPRIIKGMDEVYTREVEHLNSQGDKGNVSAQVRKEFHQTQQGIKKGFPTEISAGAKQAHDLLRDGLKAQLETTNKGIKELNEPYGGLKEASRIVRELAASARNTKPTGKFQTAINHLLPFLYNSPGLKSAMLARDIARGGKSTERQLKDIKNLREKSKLKDVIKKPADTKKENQKPEPADRSYIQIEGGKRLALPPGRIQPKVLQLPKGQGFEIVDPVESAGRLRMDKFKKDYVPVERNVRSSQKAPSKLSDFMRKGTNISRYSRYSEREAPPSKAKLSEVMNQKNKPTSVNLGEIKLKPNDLASGNQPVKASIPQFKSANEAISYGKSIAGRTSKIKELEDQVVKLSKLIDEKVAKKEMDQEMADLVYGKSLINDALKKAKEIRLKRFLKDE